MRRLLPLVTALGLIGGGIGCNHFAGVCDCEPHNPCMAGCCGGVSPAAPVAGAPVDYPTGGPVYPAGATQPEPIQVMPQEK